MLGASRRSNIYQFYSLLCDTTGGRIHSISHMRRACYPLHHRCGWELLQIVLYAQDVWHSPYTRHPSIHSLLTSCVFNSSAQIAGVLISDGDVDPIAEKLSLFFYTTRFLLRVLTAYFGSTKCIKFPDLTGIKGKNICCVPIFAIINIVQLHYDYTV
jgi:hypothetical protein